MTKKFLRTAFLISMALTLSACGTQAESTSGEASSAQESSASSVQEANASSESQAADSNNQIANPFTEVQSLEEAASITGFTLKVPDAPQNYPDMTIRVMDSSMIEVIFENKASESQSGAVDEGYRIRKEAGISDISGDSNEYSNVREEKIGDQTVTLKGEGDTVSVAVWNANGYSYAVDAEDHPLSVSQIEEIVSAIQ